jgi:hypothetical protein
MVRKSKSFRISEELLARIDEHSANRTGFVVDAVKEKLARIENGGKEVKKVDSSGVVDGNALLTFQKALLTEAKRRPDFLQNLDNETFAKLFASRLPKDVQGNEELEADALSLRSCLDRMPSMPDLTADLNRVRGLLCKAEHERDMNLKILEHNKNKVELGELMKYIWKGAVEYVVEMVARGNLPGFGDGRGITEKAYAEIARKVEGWLEEMEVFRKK